MVVKVGSVRSQALVKSAESLSVSVTADRGFWILKYSPSPPPPQAGRGAACLLYLTSQPESWGPVRLWGRASTEKRTEEKERSNYVQSLSSEDLPPPRFITGALHWRQNVGHLERKEQECFGGIWHLQIPALAREARLRSPHPLLLGCGAEKCRNGLITWLAHCLHFFICTASRFTSLAFQDRGPTLLLFVHSYFSFQWLKVEFSVLEFPQKWKSFTHPHVALNPLDFLIF